MTKKKKKKNFKYWAGKAHLWLGLTSGLIVLMLGITGCIFAFSQEINEWQRHDVIYVPEVKAQKLPPSVVWNKMQQTLGDTLELGDMHVYKDPEKSYEFHSYKIAETKSIWYFDEIEYYYHIYVDPYTGEILGIYNEEMDFFNIVKMLHWSLLLKTAIGQPIVGWATFIFVIMLITGIILWWPKNKAARKQRLSFQWKSTTKWRRKNYDLHNILGFYISAIALIVAFTGMAMAFTWFQSVVYVAGSQSFTPPPKPIVKESTLTTGDTDKALDTAAAITWQKYPDADAISIGKPENPKEAIQSYVQPYKGKYYVYHHLQFDQYTGKLLHITDHNQKNFGEKLLVANYDIHVGAILGIPGKIIAFIISFISAMLPVTGFMIWWGRTKKQKKTTLS